MSLVGAPPDIVRTILGEPSQIDGLRWTYETEDGGQLFVYVDRVVTLVEPTNVLLRTLKKRFGDDITIHDGDYDFMDQRIYPIDIVDMAAGDKVQMTCTYDNDTGADVPFGDSSNDEMCFLGIYRYPAGSGSISCL